MDTLCKAERLYKRTLIEKLFSRGSYAFTVFPLRVIYTSVDELDVNAILISVSKRRFKRAVKRNRVKRQIREAYRRNKSLLKTDGEKHWLVAFVYLSDELLPSYVIDNAVCTALQRVV
ncbi:MAG: ribonuclease P protein component [Bacteroidales bacterium]|nr:ribonuclease P protein component [Bacteroidales bacterium]